MQKKRSLSAYWWCQLLGWGAVVPYWFYYQLDSKSLPMALLIVVLQAILQVFVTDQYRRLTHRCGWLQLPLLKLLPIVFAAWLVLIGQYLLMSFLVFSFQYEAQYFFQNNVLLGALAGGARYHAIWLLGFHLYHFARQSADQTAVAARNAQLAAEAQLAKLSGELNPHFLFNALNGIKALTREDPARSRLAIDRLAELLRYSLRQSERKLVPLAEEIHIIKEYVALEQMRLEERLLVNWSIDPTSKDCCLPPLSLHTLVENAIKHGISSLPKGGEVGIELSTSPTHWEFTVTNDGHFSPVQARGTGLLNLRRRLELQYGGHARFSIQSLTPVGDVPRVMASLKLPRL